MTSKINKINSGSEDNRRNHQLLALIGAQYPAILRQAQVQIQITPQMVQASVSQQSAQQDNKLQQYSNIGFRNEQMDISAANPIAFTTKAESVAPNNSIISTPNGVGYSINQQSFITDFLSSNASSSPLSSSFQNMNPGRNVLVWSNNDNNSNSNENNQGNEEDGLQNLRKTILWTRLE